MKYRDKLDYNIWNDRDLQIISLDDPNIKEIVGAEAIAGRAHHTGGGKFIEECQ